MRAPFTRNRYINYYTRLYVCSLSLKKKLLPIPNSLNCANYKQKMHLVETLMWYRVGWGIMRTLKKHFDIFSILKKNPAYYLIDLLMFYVS